MKRLNAIFTFIENAYTYNDVYFDVKEFSRANQARETGLFSSPSDSAKFLTQELCADFLDYQLAVTIYPIEKDNQAVEVFGRINSGGKQLSSQEKRQAGMIDTFSNLIRVLSSEIRGDASRERLPLVEMPEISIDSQRLDLGYALKAEDIFWCKQGILWVKQLRDSEDEEMLVDIVSSIVLGDPIARSKELLDDLYNKDAEIYKEVRTKLAAYGEDRVQEEVKVTLSVLKEIIDAVDLEQNALRKTINPKSTNPIKAAFFSLFMALYELVIVEEKSPADCHKIMSAIAGLQKKMKTSANYSKTEDRIKNIDITKGLIQKYFIHKDPPLLRHGAGLAIDFENSIRRSKIETSRYECKQGLIDLTHERKIDNKLLQKIINTLCGIANIGPDSDGFLFIGVADKKEDSEKIEQLDGVSPLKIGTRYVVGVDRELKYLKCNLESYLAKIISKISESELSEPLKSGILSQIDTVDYKGMTVIRIRVPKQREISFLGEIAYIREGSSTVEAKGKKLLSINNMFS